MYIFLEIKVSQKGHNPQVENHMLDTAPNPIWLCFTHKKQASEVTILTTF